MNNDWSPAKPPIRREFEKHSVGQTDPPKQEKREIVTKQQVEELERQLRKQGPKLELTPPGMKTSSQWDAERRERLEQKKQRLRSVPMRQDFQRSAEREGI